MSINVPIISVSAVSSHHDGYEHHYTSSSSESDKSSINDMDYNQHFGGITDVEDFDSCADGESPRSRRSSKNSLVIPKGSPKTQGDVTDVEDFNDSEVDEEDDKSAVFPQLKLSLQEFMELNVIGHLSTNNGVKEVVEHKSGNFLQAQNLNTLNDYLTDCEDYNTDSDIEKNYEKSACVDLNEAFVDQGRVNIADTTVNSKDYEDSDVDNDDISIVSDISGMDSAVKNFAGTDEHGMSEDEILELSSNEEICQISCSDSGSTSNQGNNSEEAFLSSASLAPIDVVFIQAANRPKLYNDPFVQDAFAKDSGPNKNMFLEVKENKKEEVLTDSERFDDSVAEGDDEDSFDGDGDDDNQQPIPQAVIMAIGDDGGCVTDCEDLPNDDASETADSVQEAALSVDLNAIPLPQREVVMLQENKFGNTITNVMPMDKEYQFGIYTTPTEECVTDIEEYSCADDLDVPESTVDLVLRSPSPLQHNLLVESDVTVSNEVLKTHQSKRLEIIANAESVTDVEEIYMDGTNSRRKKLKTRTISKGKSKYLETPKSSTKDGVSTDVEDMDLSDSGLPGVVKYVKTVEPNDQTNQCHSDKGADVEDVTADEVLSVPKTEMPLIETNTFNLRDYEASSKNIVVTLETCGPMSSNKHNTHKMLNNTDFPREYYNQQTDFEYVKLPLNTDDCLKNSGPPAVDCGCHELNEMISESRTTVHEKCSNSFNVDAEKLHIKGMMLLESHTDIEYVESDESAAKGSK